MNEQLATNKNTCNSCFKNLLKKYCFILNWQTALNYKNIKEEKISYQ